MSRGAGACYQILRLQRVIFGNAKAHEAQSAAVISGRDPRSFSAAAMVSAAPTPIIVQWIHKSALSKN
jgi:hypothetical protein